MKSSRPRLPGILVSLAIVAGWLLSPIHRCAAGQITLNDVTQATGINFVHTDGSSGERYIVETVTAGLALFDYDGDGWVDIYCLNGAPLKGSTYATPPRNALYRNNGDGTFTDVTESAGVGDTGYGLGVTVGDFDNDGDPDLYLNNYGTNVLYRNNGDGTFTDITQAAGVSDPNHVGAGACFLDIDQDGQLDLFVGHYLEFSYDKHVRTTQRGYPIYANPRYYRAVPSVLFRNNGDGTFSDVSQASGIGEHAGYCMGVVAADFDRDGNTDIFVANDVMGNFLFRGDGRGHFKEVGVESGFAYDANGDEQGSMGIDCGDFDNDGWLDFYVTSYQNQLATLYRNLQGRAVEDVTLLTGAGAGTLQHVTWGCSFVDLDNDGFRDLFVACGHLQDNVDLYDGNSSYLATNIVLRNTGAGKFIDVSTASGDGLKLKRSARGAGFDDLDNDGDIDVVILNARQAPTVLRNDSPGQGHWLQLRLRGVKTNRDAVGAQVRLTAGDLTLVDEVHSGRGYQSHYGSRLYFGLGARERIDRIEVRWLGGGVEVFENIAVDRLITLVEGRSGKSSP